MVSINKSISVFLPFYNEEELVEEVSKEVLDYLEQDDRDFELLLINDGSEDATGPKIDQFADQNSNTRAIHHFENKGYGRALATGFEKSENDIIFYMDGDGQFSIEEIEKFLSEIPDFDLVIGYRKERDDSFTRKITSEVFNSLVRFLLPLNFKDIDCGSKMLKKEILSDIELNTERTVDAELLAKSVSNGKSMKEVPVKHFKRDKGESEAEGLIGVRPNLVIKSIREVFQIRREIK